MIKMITLLSIISSFFLFQSCDTLKDEITDNKQCLIKSMTIDEAGKQKTLKFKYDSGKLKSIKNIDLGSKSTFEYDSLGNIICVNSGRISMHYSYAQDSSLTEIIGKDKESEIVKYSIHHNDQNQLEKVQFYSIGYLQTTKEYSYNEDGQITGMKEFDGEGNLNLICEINYDNKNNPFVKTSAGVNYMSRKLGYPVGESSNNVTSIVTTYKSKTNYRVNGELKEPGDIVTKTFEYEYNSSGYPTRITYDTESGETIVNLEYDCREK